MYKPGRTRSKVTVAVLLGVAVGLGGVATAGELYKNSLRTRVETIATALDTARVDRLRQTPPGAQSGDYEYIKAKLAAIKQSNGDIRFAYLMARDQQGRIYFLADSERPGSAGYSPRGELYPEASPALKAMFDNNRDLVEGPLKDRYGTWLSALTPVINDQTYGFVGVVGIDVPSSTYDSLLAIAGGVPILIGLLAAGMIIAADRARRHSLDTVRFRAELASVASHELRTPLTGLRWTEETLLKQDLPAAARQPVQDLYDSTLRLQESIEDVLQMASLDAGKARRLSLQECDVRAMLDAIFAMQKLAAGRRGIVLHYAAGWPKHVMVMADEQRLKRALNNLVSNSIKYSKPHSSVRLRYETAPNARQAKNAKSAKQSHMHIIAVQDHGIGIPIHEQSKVFGGFYRATNAEATQAGGTGMGLYMARQVIEQHGGTLRLESVEGKGTTMYVALPKA